MSKVIIIISLKLAKSYAVVAAKKNLRQAPPPPNCQFIIIDGKIMIQMAFGLIRVTAPSEKASQCGAIVSCRQRTETAHT